MDRLALKGRTVILKSFKNFNQGKHLAQLHVPIASILNAYTNVKVRLCLP